MKKILLALFATLLLWISSCQKCYECKQYCAYCTSVSDSSLIIKVCANDEATSYKADSLRNVYQNNGFHCNLLQNDKQVCDSKDQINSAVSYYLLEDYYCVSTK